jgi:hypothetical protein
MCDPEPTPEYKAMIKSILIEILEERAAKRAGKPILGRGDL